MANEDAVVSPKKLDFYSKYVALFFALGLLVVGLLLTAHLSLSATVSAISAIGVRILIPYYAVVTRDLPDESSTPVLPGDYHYGAVGGALLVAPLVTLVYVLAVQPVVWISYVVGGAAGVVLYFVLQQVLPRD